MQCETLQKLEKEQQSLCEKSIKGNGFFGTAFLIIVALGFLGVGILLSGYGFIDACRGMASKKWPTVNGSVQGVKISELYIGGANSRGGQAHIKYTYSIEGIEYTSNRWRFDADYPFYEANVIGELYNKYPGTAKAKIYYHPRKPRLSVLEPGFRKTTILTIAIGVLPILIGILIIRFSRVKHVISAIPDFPIHMWKRGG